MVTMKILQGQDVLEFKRNVFCSYCRRPAREWVEPDRAGRYIVHPVLENNNIAGFLCPECVILELRRQLAAYKEAAREAVESSVPYIARFNAFLISAEAWHKLALLVCPELSALDELFCRLAAGQKLSEEEIKSVLNS